MTSTFNLHRIIECDAVTITPKMARSMLINLGNILKSSPQFTSMVEAATHFEDDERALYIAGVLFYDRPSHIIRDASLGLFVPESYAAAGLAISAASTFPDTLGNPAVANFLCAHVLSNNCADDEHHMTLKIATEGSPQHDLSRIFLHHFKAGTWETLRAEIAAAAEVANKSIYNGVI